MLIKLKNGTEFQFMDKLTMGVLYAISPLIEKGMENLTQHEQLKLFEVFINSTLTKPIDFQQLPLEDFKELIENPQFKTLLQSASMR